MVMYNLMFDVNNVVPISDLENVIQDWNLQLFNDVYEVGSDQSCRFKDDRVLHYPWFGMYPYCLGKGTLAIKEICSDKN